MKRLVLAAFALIVLVAAAQPADVAPLLESQGFFVEDGSDADPEAVGWASEGDIYTRDELASSRRSPRRSSSFGTRSRSTGSTRKRGGGRRRG